MGPECPNVNPSIMIKIQARNISTNKCGVSLDSCDDAKGGRK